MEAEGLRTEGVSKKFAGVVALDGVDLRLVPGEIVGLIGPNGAGKTTLFEVISGLQRPDRGRIYLDGRDVTNWSAWRRCHAGLARTFQVVRPLRGLTVWENVLVGAFTRHGSPAEAENVVWESLQRVGLAELRGVRAGDLTLAQQKRLEIARALATKPRYLLLDECFAGLRAGEQDVAMQLVRDIASDGVGVLLIEHSMRIVMNLAHRVQVLHYGRTIAEGTPDEIASNADVISAYLGERHSAERSRS